MEALIRKGRRAHSFRRFARSAAAVLLMALMVAGIWLAFDGEARAEFLRWIRNEYENGIVYKFFARREEKMLPDVEVGWLPEGYAESVRKISSDHGYILFIDDNGERLVLYYRYMYSATSYSITCDNNVVREEVFVNGEIADFYLDKGKESQNLLFWSNDNWGIKFNLDAALDKEVMIKIAENIRIIE